MRYPTIQDGPCEDLAHQLIGGIQPSLELQVEWVGEGVEIDLGRIVLVASEVASDLSESATDSEREQFEADVAIALYSALAEVDIEVLDDPGFWRYLSLMYFWGFIQWREAKAFERGNYLKYVDGRSSTDCVLTRMYLRGVAVGGESYSAYTSGLPRSTDFWRSHVLRVRTGTAPPIVRALVDTQQRYRFTTTPLRQFAKSLNRVWSNVVLAVYDDESSADLIERIRRQLNLDASTK